MSEMLMKPTSETHWLSQLTKAFLFCHIGRKFINFHHPLGRELKSQRSESAMKN
jgi:hypothetical protein